MENTKYRVVYAGGLGRLHKTYFKHYTSALAFYGRACRGLHPYGYTEIQELEKGAYITVESEVGRGIA